MTDSDMMPAMETDQNFSDPFVVLDIPWAPACRFQCTICQQVLPCLILDYMTGVIHTHCNRDSIEAEAFGD